MRNSLTMYDKAKLIEMGIIITESEDVFDSENGGMPDEQQPELMADPNEEDSNFPDADYELQNEIIRFFSNNPGADPEIFRQYAASLGVEPDELQKQMNILFSQLLQLYLRDAEELGYGNALSDDEEVPEDLEKLLAPQPQL